jgi:hypothetical protein
VEQSGVMSHKILPAAQALTVLAVSGATTFGLHLLGNLPWLSVDWSNPARWFTATPPAEALLAMTRLLGLACGWWIVISTVCYLAAGLSPTAGRVRLAAPITPPFIRSLVAKMLVGTVVLSTAANAAPTMASTVRSQFPQRVDSYPVPMAGPPSPPAPVDSQTMQTHPLSLPLPWLDGAPTHLPMQKTSASPVGATVVHPILSRTSLGKPGDYHLVAAGDHLWAIARETLARTISHPPNTRQITSYWVDLIEANRERIHSNDPNLLYPGESILLPQVRKT